MKDPAPVIVAHLFPRERRRLIELLDALSPAQFDLETYCPGWTVKDILAHVVGDDLGALSHGGDGYTAGWYDPSSREDLVAYINHHNGLWVDALRGLSPRVITEL